MDITHQRIIYRNEDGSIGVLIPTDCGLSIEQIAAKDVPAGRPYKIVGLEDMPADRSQRALWTADTIDLTDGVGADYGVGSDREVIGWTDDGSPILGGST